MSDNAYQRLIEHIQQNVAQPIIATDTGLEAARQVGEIAAQEESELFEGI